MGSCGKQQSEAWLLERELSALSGGAPLILAGDLNSSLDSMMMVMLMVMMMMMKKKKKMMMMMMMMMRMMMQQYGAPETCDLSSLLHTQTHMHAQCRQLPV